MRDVYLISGLGADERIFQRLQLERCRVHDVHWIEPLKRESMSAYARRLSEQILAPEPVLIGMSFGGMIAVEISQFRSLKGLILVSSVRYPEELPPYFQLLHVLPIHRWLPYSWLQALGIVLGKWLFGPETPSTHELLKQIIRETDETFFRWAWQQIISWQKPALIRSSLHIHGSRDRMLPICFVKHVDHVIRGGTHLMMLDRADEINPIMQDAIDRCFASP